MCPSYPILPGIQDVKLYDFQAYDFKPSYTYHYACSMIWFLAANYRLFLFFAKESKGIMIMILLVKI